MKGRLRELRESRHLTQTGIGNKVGVSQQNISKYEQDIRSIPIDMLLHMAKYFNVTTDYLLGYSDIKRSYEGQMLVSKSMDEYYDLIEMYRDLDKRDQEIIWAMIEKMSKSNTRRQP